MQLQAFRESDAKGAVEHPDEEQNTIDVVDTHAVGQPKGAKDVIHAVYSRGRPTQHARDGVNGNDVLRLPARHAVRRHHWPNAPTHAVLASASIHV